MIAWAFLLAGQTKVWFSFFQFRHGITRIIVLITIHVCVWNVTQSPKLGQMPNLRHGLQWVPTLLVPSKAAGQLRNYCTWQQAFVCFVSDVSIGQYTAVSKQKTVWRMVVTTSNKMYNNIFYVYLFSSIVEPY